jgi:hypothetical protein
MEIPKKNLSIKKHHLRVEIHLKMETKIQLTPFKKNIKLIQTNKCSMI